MKLSPKLAVFAFAALFVATTFVVGGHAFAGAPGASDCRSAGYKTYEIGIFNPGDIDMGYRHIPEGEYKIFAGEGGGFKPGAVGIPTILQACQRPGSNHTTRDTLQWTGLAGLTGIAVGIAFTRRYDRKQPIDLSIPDFVASA